MGPTGRSALTPGQAAQAARALVSGRIGKWVLIAMFLGPLLPIVGIGSVMILWTCTLTAGARTFVHEHFEAVRHKKASAPSGAPADSRDAYTAVAASTGEDLPTLLPYKATSDMSETCLDAELITKGGGRRAVSLVVRGHDGDKGAETFEVFDISLTRRCNCSHTKTVRNLAHCQLD
jgi:hypothetical protein